MAVDVSFRIIEAGPLPDYHIVYREQDWAFEAEADLEHFASVSLDTLQVEFDRKARLLYPWGYCPHTAWRPASLTAPQGIVAGVQVVASKPFIAGASLALGGVWTAWADRVAGWICVGDPADEGERVTVNLSSHVKVGITNGRLRAVWLHPKAFPAGWVQ
jgi:hypothetical protein